MESTRSARSLDRARFDATPRHKEQAEIVSLMARVLPYYRLHVPRENPAARGCTQSIE